VHACGRVSPSGDSKVSGFMTTIAHTAVGGAMGAGGANAPVSFMLGAVSHYPLDIIPHWDLENMWIDTALTLGALAALLIFFGNGPVFWGALGGALPDLEHLLPHRRKLYPSHGARHGRPLGGAHAFVQLALIVLCGWLIFAGGRS
jgi:hypothetical protein